MAPLLSADEAAVVQSRDGVVLLSYGSLRAGLEPADLPASAGRSLREPFRSGPQPASANELLRSCGYDPELLCH